MVHCVKFFKIATSRVDTKSSVGINWPAEMGLAILRSISMSGAESTVTLVATRRFGPEKSVNV